jgi:ABC-2 type transport system permease protein
MSKAITEKRDDKPTPGGSSLLRETAPSVMRDDDLVVPRWVGAIALVLTLVGGDLLLWAFTGGWSLIRLLVRGIGSLFHFTPLETLGTWSLLLATVFFVLGLTGLIFHASVEREVQLRRLYGLLASLWFVAGVALFVFEALGASWAGNLLTPAVGCLLLALAFFLTFIRSEKEPDYRNAAVYVLGGAGAVAAVAAFLFGNLFPSFLLPGGFVLALLGLAYLWAFIVCRGDSDDLASKVALGSAGLGLLVFLVAFIRSYVVGLFSSWVGPYLIPNGLILMALGLLYAGLYALIRLDFTLLALTRRELASLFFSPIAYIVLLIWAFAGWVGFVLLLLRAVYEPALPMGEASEPLLDPIVVHFIIGIIPILFLIIIVPLLTMRVLSEERRTGSLEVLLTAPVSETAVVLSKFFALLIFFLISFVPWGLYLVALRIVGDTPFDFIPVLSFLVALTFSGAGFLSMGLFCSSVTRNQIISAVLCVLGMLLLFFTYWVKQIGEFRADPDSAWVKVWTHVSFIDLWIQSLEGKLTPSLLLFPLSATVFWLFATVKVLEARKWT